jgi:hypothetical protein
MTFSHLVWVIGVKIKFKKTFWKKIVPFPDLGRKLYLSTGEENCTD